MIRIIIIIALFLVNCGSDNDNKNQETQKKIYSLATTQKNLPLCGTENDKQLVYLEDKKEFLNCSNGSWNPIEIGKKTIAEEVSAGAECKNGGIKITTGEEVQFVCNGEDGQEGQQGIAGNDGSNGKDGDGLEVSEQWVFSSNTYVGSPSVSNEALNLDVFISNVQVTVMNNGHYFAEISGFIDDINLDQTSEFSHSMWLTGNDLTAMQTETRKIRPYNNMTIGYIFQKAAGSFVLDTTVDVDADYSNNGDNTIVRINTVRTY